MPQLQAGGVYNVLVNTNMAKCGVMVETMSFTMIQVNQIL
jgi:hypothetical protein